MGIRCCKSDDKEDNQIVEGKFNTKAFTYPGDYKCDDIYKTRPPCWYGHECSCPCHNGGECVNLNKFYIYIKSFIYITDRCF